ncbi:MAG: flagellar biosynthetic protein FliO [Deltaproteobacteria bacterium]|nr:flagellar biosynthetic protein FliO [Deltaproteobacteria bacterium]
MKSDSSCFTGPLGLIFSSGQFGWALVASLLLGLVFFGHSSALAQEQPEAAASEITVSDIGSEVPNEPPEATVGSQAEAGTADGPAEGTPAAPLGEAAAPGETSSTAGTSSPPSAETPGQNSPISLPPRQDGLPDPFGGFDLIKTIGAFLIVIVLLVICLKVLRHLTRGRRFGKGGQTFSLRGTMIIDSRKYLAAVEVDGHLVVVGVTPERLSGLASWPLAETDDFEDDNSGPKLGFEGPTTGRPLGQPLGASAGQGRNVQPGPTVSRQSLAERSREPQAPRPTSPESSFPPVDAPRQAARPGDSDDIVELNILAEQGRVIQPPKIAVPDSESQAAASREVGPEQGRAAERPFLQLDKDFEGPDLGASLEEAGPALEKIGDFPLSLDETPDSRLNDSLANDDFIKIFQDDFDKEQK